MASSLDPRSATVAKCDRRRRQCGLRFPSWSKLQRSYGDAVSKLHRDGDLALVQAVAVRFTTMCFFIASLALLGLWTRSFSRDHHMAEHTRSMVGTTFTVVTIAFVAYAAKSAGLGHFKWEDRDVPMVRYLDWFFTTPLLLEGMSALTNAPASITALLLLADVLMLAFGLVSAYARSRQVRLSTFGAACVCFVAVLLILQSELTTQASARGDPHAMMIFEKIRVLTVCSWSCYPVITFLGPTIAALIPAELEEVLLCIVDLASKVGVELILLVGHAALEHSHLGHHGHLHGVNGAHADPIGTIWSDVRDLVV